MFLCEPQQTPFDIHFRLFGIPIRVHPFFWLGTVILGWSFKDEGMRYLLLWIACVFVSILVHEMGHVFAGRLFGTSGHIVLYSFGGLAIGSRDVPRRWQRIVVSLAGPLAQVPLWAVSWFLLRKYGLEWALTFQNNRTAELFLMGLIQLKVINLYWPLFNLLPIWPLDGGQISRELCEGLRPRNGARICLMISIAIAALIIGNSILALNDRPHIPYIAGDKFTILLFIMLALGNFQELQMLRFTQAQFQSDRRAPWEQDADYWKR